MRGGVGMDVPPHPHTGLQTVSWLFEGEVEHRDSAGVHALVRPGELNLMTAGAGICHSEVSTAATTVLHGVQLWVALPDSDRDTGRDFAHYAPEAIAVPGAVLRVFLGELSGSRSPVHTFTPLLGAQIDLDPGARVDARRRPVLRARRAAGPGPPRGGGHRARCRGPGVSGHRSRCPHAAQPGRQPGPGGAARRPAVHRATGHVVELRRPQPRRHRHIPPAVGGPRRPLRCRRGIPRRRRSAAGPSAPERHAAATPESEGKRHD